MIVFTSQECSRQYTQDLCNLTYYIPAIFQFLKIYLPKFQLYTKLGKKKKKKLRERNNFSSVTVTVLSDRVYPVTSKGYVFNTGNENWSEMISAHWQKKVSIILGISLLLIRSKNNI